MDLVAIVNAYKTRKFDEDIKVIEDLGNLDGIAGKLKTSWKEGISAHTVEDLNQRDLAFGTNKKDKFKRTRKKP